MADDKKDKKENKKKVLKSLEDRMTKDIDTYYLETGTVGVDLGITNGKGLPLGDWITIVAEAGFGKSTICGDLLRRVLTRHKKNGIPFKAIYIDIEDSKNLLVSMGLGQFILDQDLMHMPGRITFEELDVLYDTIMSGENEKYKDVKLIVIDSITSVISSKNALGNCEDSEFGNDAKSLSKFLKKQVPLHSEKKITTLSICQVRQKQGASVFEDPKKGAVIDAAKHFSTVIMKLSKRVGSQDKEMKKIKIMTSDGIVETQEKFTIVMSTHGTDRKNRHGKVPDVSILVEYGKRIINAYTIKNVLTSWGLIKGASGWYSVSKDLPVEVKDTKYTNKEINAFVTQNRCKLIEYLKENNMYTPYVGKVEEEDDGYAE